MNVEQRISEFLDSGNWPALAALLIWAIVRGMKSDRIPFDVPARARPWVALGLGGVAGVCEAVITGALLQDAILRGLGAGFAASGLHEVWIESMRHGREPLSMRPPPLVDPPRESRRPPPDDKPPSGGGWNVTIMSLALVIKGCGGGSPNAERLLHSARDVAVFAEACAVETKRARDAQCNGSEACLADVRAQYAPLVDALDAFHFAWCAVSPQSEGCDR